MVQRHCGLFEGMIGWSGGISVYGEYSANMSFRSVSRNSSMWGDIEIDATQHLMEPSGCIICVLLIHLFLLFSFSGSSD